MFKWYQIIVDDVELSSGQTSTLFYQLAKYELYLSPHVRLAGHAKQAQIETRDLAEAFAARCLPIFKKRYGDDTTLTVGEWSTHSPNKNLIKRIEKDSKIIKTRLEQNNMASNKKLILAP